MILIQTFFFQNFVKEARAAHAEINLNSEAISISSAKGKWHVDTKTERFSASVLINASGAWADKTAALSGITPLGFMPYRRSIARIPVPGGFDPIDWPLFDEINERWYAKPDAGHLLVATVTEKPHGTSWLVWQPYWVWVGRE